MNDRTGKSSAPARPPVSVRSSRSGRPAREQPAPRIPPALARSAPLAALWTGFGAAVVGCFVAVIAALLAWIPDAGATGSSASTVRAGVITFLAAQHGGIRLNGITMHFVPLGLTLIVLWICWRAGRALHAVPVVRTDRRSMRIVRLAAWQLAGYVLTCAALVPFARVGTTSVPPLGAVGGAVVVGAIGFGSSALRHTPLGRRGVTRLPAAVRSGLRGSLGAVGVFLAAGALLVGAATIEHAGRFIDLSRALGRGAAGLPIAVLDLLSAPNAVLAGTSYLSGPGFAIGVHSTYAPFGARAGLVPAFPIIAGLPGGSRASSIVIALLAMTIAAAGLVSGVLVQRATRHDGWLSTLLGAVLAGAGGGLLLAVLVGAGGGSLGQHNLRAVGASPWQVGVIAAGEIAALAVPVAAAARVVASVRHRRLERPIAPASSSALTPAGSNVTSASPVALSRPVAVVPDPNESDAETDEAAADEVAADEAAADEAAAEVVAAEAVAADEADEPVPDSEREAS